MNKKINILIVDDDEINIFALKAVLLSRGYMVSSVLGGFEAIDVLKNSNDIDLVLMDIMMPVIDGYQTIFKIRNELNLVKLPIIALTAKAMKGDMEKCIESGADAYCAKPVNIDELESIIFKLI